MDRGGRKKYLYPQSLLIFQGAFFKVLPNDFCLNLIGFSLSLDSDSRPGVSLAFKGSLLPRQHVPHDLGKAPPGKQGLLLLSRLALPSPRHFCVCLPEQPSRGGMRESKPSQVMFIHGTLNSPRALLCKPFQGCYRASKRLRPSALI